MCQQLWESSAKCYSNFEAAESNWNYLDYMQDANEEVVCDYIYALGHGYSEEGTIVLDPNLWQFNSSNWKDWNEYLHEGQVLYNAANNSRVSNGRIAGLIISSVAVFVMLIWACCLHGALVRANADWRPRRSKYVDPETVSRQNSGIVLGRSRSEKENPLI
jgi:hypothetical protein